MIEVLNKGINKLFIYCVFKKPEKHKHMVEMNKLLLKSQGNQAKHKGEENN